MELWLKSLYKINKQYGYLQFTENKTDKIDLEALAKYIITRKNNIISMDKNAENTYTNLKGYVYT